MSGIRVAPNQGCFLQPPPTREEESYHRGPDKLHLLYHATPYHIPYTSSYRVVEPLGTCSCHLTPHVHITNVCLFWAFFVFGAAASSSLGSSARCLSVHQPLVSVSDQTVRETHANNALDTTVHGVSSWYGTIAIGWEMIPKISPFSESW